MRLYDQHVHTRHSFDSEAKPAKVVEQAIAVGLAGLTFTEHFDTHPIDWEGCVYDDKAYSATIKKLRAKFGDRIFVGKGVEVCFQPDRIHFIRDFLDSHEFDLVMLSVHYFGGRPVYERDHWTDRSPAEGTRLYLEHVLEAVQCCEKLNRTAGRVFDVLGHLDFVKRYTQRFFGEFDVATYGGLIDEILDTCVAADLVPEINTSSIRKGVGESMPTPQALARYAQAGGTGVSFGSDAHRVEEVGVGFDQVVSQLQEVGIQSSVVFKNRQRHDISLFPPLLRGD